MSSSSESVFLRFNDREDSLPSIDFESGDDLFLLLLDPPWEAGDPFRLLLGPPWEVFDPLWLLAGSLWEAAAQNLIRIRCCHQQDHCYHDVTRDQSRLHAMEHPRTGATTPALDPLPLLTLAGRQGVILFALGSFYLKVRCTIAF